MLNDARFILVALSLTLFSFTCNKDSAATDDNTISDALHMSFTTPDWSKFINCDLLNLYPSYINDSTTMVSATSASTKETFYFSIPVDSSGMMKSGNLRKYAIHDYGNNAAPFEFSQKLPLTEGGSTYLVSEYGLSDSSYNEVAAIRYLGSETNYALFDVKCRYKMVMYENPTIQNRKNVSGTFNFKVRALRK